MIIGQLSNLVARRDTLIQILIAPTLKSEAQFRLSFKLIVKPFLL